MPGICHPGRATSCLLPPAILQQLQLLIAVVTAMLTSNILQSASNAATMGQASRSVEKILTPVPEPELTLRRHNQGVDRHLVDLVRLLARRAARGSFEAQIEERQKTRS